MIFNLDASEMDKIEQWLKEIEPKILEITGRDRPYYGAAGGGLTFEITPLSIGVVIKAREFYTGEVLDLSDYSDW